MTVRRLDDGDWQVLARTRLRALAESPGAFLSTLEREQGYGEAEWRERIRRAAWFVAGADAPEPAGLCAVLLGGDLPPEEAHLISMWVAPERRGEGLAAELLGAAAGHGAGHGAIRLGLWVMRDNARAIRAYEKQGLREAEPPEGAHDYRCDGELFLARRIP